MKFAETKIFHRPENDPLIVKELAKDGIDVELLHRVYERLNKDVRDKVFGDSLLHYYDASFSAFETHR